MFGSSYNPTKLKLNLKLAITRVGMLQKKNENSGILARKEVAKLLEKGKDELARIKVEQIIRDDYYVETLELMEMYLNLLIARFGLIETVKHCDQGILEAVTTVVWASPRMQGDIEELKEIKVLLQARYGREFVEDALENRSNTVNPRVIHKLSVHQPDPALVEGYLETIADKYKVQYTPRQAQNLIDTPVDVFDPAKLPPPPGGQPGGGAGGYGGGGFGGINLLMPEKPSYPPPASAAYPPQNFYAPQPMPQPIGGASSISSLFPPVPSSQPQQVYPPQQQPVYPPQQPTSAFNLPSVPSGFGEERVDPFARPPASASGGALDMDLPEVPNFPPVPQSSTSPRPSADVGSGSTGSNVPDFDELTRRFNALKGRK